MTLDEMNKKDSVLYIDAINGTVTNPAPEEEDPIFAPTISAGTSEANKAATGTMTAAEYDALEKAEQLVNAPDAESTAITAMDGEELGRVVLDKESLSTVDISEIAPDSAKEQESDPFMDKVYSDLDIAIEREKKEITDLHADILDHQLEELNKAAAEEEPASREEAPVEYKYEEADEDADIMDDSPVAATVRFVKPSETPVPISDIDDEDIFTDIENEGGAATVAPEDQDALVKKMVTDLSTVARDNIVPIKDKIDPSKFTISKKPISISSLLRSENVTPIRAADWVLYATGRSITMSALSGPEIEKLNVSNRGNQNRLNSYRNAYMILYNHIIDSNKPTFESWLKLVRFHDIDSLYFCAYMATFEGTNYITFNCPKDHHVFLVDLKFEDMVKYKDDETKAAANKIRSMDTTSSVNEYTVELRQISDEYMVGIKAPSIFDVVIQNASLSEDFLAKYADLIDTMSYIDQIYYIDRNTNSLIPVDAKVDPNNQVKTASNRIRIYYEILKKLSSDQYYELNSYIRKIDDMNSAITYKIPEVTCPKCSTVIPEEERDASQILFTRHQLGAFANMPNM